MVEVWYPYCQLNDRETATPIVSLVLDVRGKNREVASEKCQRLDYMFRRSDIYRSSNTVLSPHRRRKSASAHDRVGVC